MKRKAMWTAVVLVLLATLAAGQAQQYLDVYTVQVKPEKRAEFDAIAKKIGAANRQNKGDAWLATETVYGQGDRVSFISIRQGYGDAEKATGAFYEAMQKAYGKPGTDKLFQDFSQCLASSRSEFRLRRWDLSSNAPTDAAAMTKLLGSSRWLRTAAVHVRPGQVAAFEALLKDVKAAREKASPPVTTPRFCSPHFRAVGKVAFEDDVANAVSMTVFTRRKNSSGEIPESSFTDSEYTPNMCSASPPITVTMNHSRACRRSSPKLAVLLNSRQATA